MSHTIKCSLCNTDTFFYKESRQKDYYRCPNCDAIQLNPKYYLDPVAEKAFYKTHNNDVENPGYQNFVKPIVNRVLEYYKPEHKGLDFGAGTGPVITKLLEEKGFTITLYDPFFANNPNALEHKYDFIVCCEVMEHFHSPKKEFKRLKSLLNDNGSLIMMTNIFDESIAFEQWFYKNDETHVFFYTKKTLHYIMNEYHFSNIYIDKRLIHLYI